MARKPKEWKMNQEDFICRVVFEFDSEERWSLVFIPEHETDEFQALRPVRACLRPEAPSSGVAHRVSAPSARACVEALMEAGHLPKECAASVLDALNVLAG